MARKNVVVYKLATAQSLAANFTSTPTLVKYLDNVAYQILATTTDSIGTFSVQASLDYAVEEVSNGTHVTNPGHWVDLTLAGGVPFVNAANDDIIINLNQLPFNAVRLAYTSNTAGTGVADIFVMARQIGG